MIGTGRQPFPSIDTADLEAHRDWAVEALREKAHSDDEERRELQRQLEEIDRAIERGAAELPVEERRRFLIELYQIEQESPS